MTRDHKIEFGMGFVIMAALIIVYGAYLHEREAKIKAEANDHAHQQIIDERDKSAGAAVAVIEKKVAQVHTPAQAAAGIGEYVVLPEPLRPVAAFPAEGGRNHVELTDAPSAFVLPKADVIPIYQGLAKGKQNEVLLAACKQDIEDLKAQRDEWKTAYRGGNWATRAVKNPKIWFVIGAAGGAFVVHELHR